MKWGKAGIAYENSYQLQYKNAFWLVGFIFWVMRSLVQPLLAKMY